MMSTTPVSPATAAGSAASVTLPAAVPERADLRAKHARAGRAMALATFAMAAASGLQALLYLRSFGVNAGTDGFFAAFALYASFGIFAQSLRVTSAPLLVGVRPRVGWVQFALALGLLSFGLAILLGPGAGPLSRLLAGDSPQARAVAHTALSILGGAMILQLWAAGAATLLAILDRFGALALAYGLGALLGLISYLALRPLAGRQTLSWSMLVMGAVTLALMVRPLWEMRARLPRRAAGAPGVGLGVGAELRITGVLLSRPAVYLAFNGLYLLTVATAAHFHAGAATIVSYAYLFASYLVAGTGFALGMARIADMSREADLGQRDLIATTVPGGFRYAMLISAPALAGLVAAAAPLVGAVLPASLPAAEVAQLQRYVLLAIPWLIAAQLVNLLLPVLFALGRSRWGLAAAPVLVLGHLAFTLLGALTAGVTGVVAAMCLAPVVFAAAMLATGRPEERRAVLSAGGTDLLRFGGLAAVAFGGAWALMPGAADGTVHCLAVGLAGSILYLVGLRWAAPAEMALLRRPDRT